MEVGAVLADRIGVRDSKNRQGPRLVLAPGQWQQFTGRLKAATLT